MRHKDKIVKRLCEYNRKYLEEPRAGMTAARFDNCSYQKWAFEEIICKVIESQEPPSMVIEEYIKMMDRFSTTGHSSKTRIIFSIAYDMGLLALDIVLKGDNDETN